MNGLKIKFAVALCFSIAACGPPALATTCEQAVAQCQIEGANKDRIVEKCQAAGASCRKTGRFVGPITNRNWKNIKRE
jgi:hypothetical protein